MTAPATMLAISLFDDFEVVCAAGEVDLAGSAQRVVAYLATSPGPVSRCRIVRDLWSDLALPTGLARLRDAVYRIRAATPELVSATGHRLAISAGVQIDVARMIANAEGVVDRSRAAADISVADLAPRDILPTWDEPWLEGTRQALTLTCARALEYLAHDRIDASLFHDAEQACRLVIRAEPYRESAYLLLAQVFIAEGNPALALCAVQDYERRLLRDLGCAPGRAVAYVERSIREATASPVG
ncbi:MAG: BTAD domain-containing putative transcriptional regulator [Ornithinimicrobium sp.]